MPACHTASRSFWRTIALAALCSTLAAPTTLAYAAEPARAKHETVQATTSASGGVNAISVTTVLETGGLDSVTDSTNLFRVESADEKVWPTNDGGLVWHSSDGRDITYTGQSNAVLPVRLKVTYSMDGSEAAAQDLLGKSGHVSVRYDYLDAQEADGTASTYAPFAALTTIPLDASVFSNVTVTNGEVVRDGDTLVVFGGGVTGAAQELSAAQTAALPTYLAFEADVSYFHLGQVTTVFSNDLPEALDSGLSSRVFASEKVEKKLEDYAKFLVEVRRVTGEAQKDANDLASRLKGTSKLADKLDKASAELEGARDSIDQISGGADVVSIEANDASSLADEFYTYLLNVDGLDEDQHQALLDRWNELNVTGALEQLRADAEALKDSSSALDFSDVSSAADDLRTINFSQLSATSRSLADTLREVMEHGFGDPDKKDKDTLIDDMTELQEHLFDDYDAALALPYQTTSALAASGLTIGAVTPQVPESAGEGAGSASKGVVDRINRAVDQAFGIVSAEAEAATPARAAYTNYGGITEGTEGSVQFVLKTAAVE